MAQTYQLTTEERIQLEALAAQDSTDGTRAAALLALASGATQATTAETTGLTLGQVKYVAKKFREQRLEMFELDEVVVGAEIVEPVAEATEEAGEETLEVVEEVSAETEERVSELLQELDDLVEEMEETIPVEEETPYSPVGLLKLVRSYAEKVTPDVQLTMLEPFEDMSREDLTDIDTWKGIAYMIAYSAQFQAEQTRDKLNDQMPEPLKPDTMLSFVRATADRFTPAIAKEIAGNFREASREDLKDPDTWKGMLYMLGYSMQFQAEQTRDKLNEQMPTPLKPDTWLNLFKAGVNKITPDVVRDIVGSFEGATIDDLKDPDTWKGVWYMLNYSLQFQAEQFKERFMGPSAETEDEDVAVVDGVEPEAS